MNNATCPICSSKDCQPDLRKRGYKIYKCEGCNHFFVHPVPTENELEGLYSSDSSYHADLGATYRTDRKQNRLFNRRIKKILHYKKSGKILDVGCSNGEFLSLARVHGFDINGVEINARTAAIARQHDIPVFTGKLEEACFPSNTFDIVNLGDIIEHVIDPNGFLHEIYRILAPGGIVILNTPNHDAFFPKTTYLLHKRLHVPWSHPTPPHHLNQFSENSIMRLLCIHGFKINEIYYSSCSLKYEIDATYAIPSLIRVFRNKQRLEYKKKLGNAAIIIACYPLIRLIDMLLMFKKRDFNMSVIAEKP